MEEAKFGAERKYGVVRKDKYQNIENGRISGMREQIDWMKRQMEYMSFSENYKLRYNLKKGEIYEIDWGLNVNAEFSNRHYGVVLMDSNEYNPLVMVCPLKTNHNGAHPRSDIDLGIVPGLATDKSTLAVINQVRTLDKLRIYKKQAIGDRYMQLAEDDYESENGAVCILSEVKLKEIINTYLSMVLNNRL